MEAERGASEARLEHAQDLVWLGTIDEDSNLQLLPTKKDIAVELATLTFPSSLADFSVDIRPPNFQTSLKQIHRRISSSRANDLIFLPGDGRYQMERARNAVPFIVKARYIVDGMISSDTSLYELQVSVSYSMGPKGTDNVKLERVTFLGVHFIGRPTTDVKAEMLNQLWENGGKTAPHLIEPDGRIMMEIR